MRKLSLLLGIVMMIVAGCAANTTFTDSEGNVLSNEEAQAIIDQATATKEPDLTADSSENTTKTSTSGGLDLPEDSKMWWTMSARDIESTLLYCYDESLDMTCREWLDSDMPIRRNTAICVAAATLWIEESEKQSIIDGFLIKIEDSDYRKEFLEWAQQVYNVLKKVAPNDPAQTLDIITLLYCSTLKDAK